MHVELKTFTMELTMLGALSHLYSLCPEIAVIVFGICFFAIFFLCPILQTMLYTSKKALSLYSRKIRTVIYGQREYLVTTVSCFYLQR
jgi:hypothetical protein